MNESKASPPHVAPPTQPTRRDEPPRYSAATVRKAIIQILATRQVCTAREIEAAVGELLPSAERASISEQLMTLSEGEYVASVPGEPGRLRLSERGESWWTGIEALAPRAA